jgi:hypothetical protein
VGWKHGCVPAFHASVQGTHPSLVISSYTLTAVLELTGHCLPDALHNWLLPVLEDPRNAFCDPVVLAPASTCPASHAHGCPQRHTPQCLHTVDRQVRPSSDYHKLYRLAHFTPPQHIGYLVFVHSHRYPALLMMARRMRYSTIQQEQKFLNHCS